MEEFNFLEEVDKNKVLRYGVNINIRLQFVFRIGKRSEGGLLVNRQEFLPLPRNGNPYVS